MNLWDKFKKWLCNHGKHDYEDKIKIVGPRTKEGLPVCVYQICKRCNETGNQVYCHINLDLKNDKG